MGRKKRITGKRITASIRLDEEVLFRLRLLALRRARATGVRGYQWVDVVREAIARELAEGGAA